MLYNGQLGFHIKSVTNVCLDVHIAVSKIKNINFNSSVSKHMLSHYSHKHYKRFQLEIQQILNYKT